MLTTAVDGDVLFVRGFGETDLSIHWRHSQLSLVSGGDGDSFLRTSVVIVRLVLGIVSCSLVNSTFLVNSRVSFDECLVINVFFLFFFK